MTDTGGMTEIPLYTESVSTDAGTKSAWDAVMERAREQGNAAADEEF